VQREKSMLCLHDHSSPLASLQGPHIIQEDIVAGQSPGGAESGSLTNQEVARSITVFQIVLINGRAIL
jgi:hypothetical protein